MNHLVIDSNWKLTQVEKGFTLNDLSSKTSWYAVDSMPAQVHDILQQHNVIQAPWKYGEAEKILWVAESNWCYQTEFDCDDILDKSILYFEGLDTIAHIYLNGREILFANDCFIPWQVDVTSLLKKKNVLTVHFPSVIDYMNSLTLPESWDGRFPARRAVRKMEQDYSEYLGPKPYFIKVGIYDAVIVKQYEKIVADSMQLNTRLSDDLQTGALDFELTGELLSNCDDVNIELTVSLEDEVLIKKTVAVADYSIAQELVYKETFVFDRPELWWYKGKGEAILYTVRAAIVQKDMLVLQQESKSIGFRKIELEDPFRFSCNNEPVRLCGANFAPLDATTQCWNPERMLKLFDFMDNAYMNVVRVWGEDGPVNDQFYDECDKRGILVWRDFVSDCMVPEDEPYASYHVNEAIIQVKRLKHHPSILIWCGGNEIYLWQSMGWDRVRDCPEVGKSFQGKKTFQRIREVVKKYDSQRDFVDASPIKGNFINDPHNGSTHGYTNMWYIPGYDHLHFAVEDTRISAPPARSLNKFMAPEDVWPEGYVDNNPYGNNSPWPETWEKYTTALSYRKVGWVENYYSATTPDEMVYKLGAAQADYYTSTIQKYRCGRPAEEGGDYRHGYGYIVWKLHDSWPEIYSSKIDFFLQPGVPYYAIRRAYRPFQLFFEVGNHIYLWGVNDTAKDMTGTIRIKLFNPRLNKVEEQMVMKAMIRAGESSVLTTLDAVGQFDRENVVYAEFYDILNEKETETSAFVEIERRLIFPTVNLSLHISEGKIVVSTDRFARAIELKCDDEEVVFDDNFFDLFPGEPKEIDFINKKPCGKVVTAKAQYNTQVASIQY